MKLVLKGKVFGRLKVLYEARTTDRCTYWLCLCSCGNKTTVNASHLARGRTKSCGCLRRQVGNFNNQKGDAGLHLAVFELAMRGGTVYLPTNGRAKADLLVEIKRKIFRVEVKSHTLLAPKGYKRDFPVRKRQRRNFDILAIVSLKTKTVEFRPEIGGLRVK